MRRRRCRSGHAQQPCHGSALTALGATSSQSYVQPAIRARASQKSCRRAAAFLDRAFTGASFNDAAGFGNGDKGHLVFGGQRPPFSLAGSSGQTWPRLGEARPVKQLNLPRLLVTPRRDGRQYVAQRPARILRHATVQARPALVLVAAPYPIGGFMGGHVIVLWNRQQHGYMLSLHFDGAPNGRASLADRVSAALRVASSFAPTTS